MKNILHNVLASTDLAKIKGPVLHEYKFISRIEQHASVYNCSVSNGFVPEGKFGYFMKVDNNGRASNSNQARLEVIKVDGFVLRTKSAESVSPYLCGSGATQNKQIFPIGAPRLTPISPIAHWDYVVERLDEWHEEHTWITYDTSTTKVVRESKIDPETQLHVLTTSEVVPSEDVPTTCHIYDENGDLQNGGANLPAPAVGGTEVVYKDIDCRKAIKVTRTICNFDTYSDTSYKNINYKFPGYLKKSDIRAGTILPPKLKKSFFFVYGNIRSSFNKLVRAKVVVDFMTAEEREEYLHGEDADVNKLALFNPIPKDAAYSGMLLRFNFRNVLIDTFDVEARTGTLDEYYGDIEETTPTFAASNISATQYATDVIAGDYKLVGESIDPWAFNLYKRTLTYVVPE